MNKNNLYHKANSRLNILFGPHTLSYKVLKKATSNFDGSILFGIGAFGVVYKAILDKHASKKLAATKIFRHVSFEQGQK